MREEQITKRAEKEAARQEKEQREKEQRDQALRKFSSLCKKIKYQQNKIYFFFRWECQAASKVP